MSVRKTESRIPGGFTSDDLGLKAVSATHANVILVSFLSSPTAARRIQNYVVFVTDAALAATVNTYEWSFTNGAVTTQTTSVGIAGYTPTNIGMLTVTVNLKNAANVTLHSVNLSQQVISLNEALELKIEQEENNFPGAGNPETSREMINDIRPYIHAILPPASNDVYNRALSSLGYARILQTPQLRRNLLIEDLANILNTQPANFYAQAKEGMGLCKTRPQLLAMFADNPASAGHTYLDPAALELAAGANAATRTTNAAAIETAFNALSVDVQVDLFNLLRFPKSHVAMAKKIADGLNSRYFAGTGIGATLGITADAKKLITEYETGPIALGTGPTALATTTFSTSVFNLFSHAVWTVPVTLMSGTAGASAGGTTTPATVGIPEKLPSLTFIAHKDTEAGFGPGSEGFLRLAFLYHDSFALNPQVIRSFEDLISTLSGATTAITRLRIVTHFGTTAGTTDLTGKGIMFLPFFTGQTQNNGTSAVNNQTHAEHFKYGVSDDEGIKAQFELIYFPGFAADFLSRLTMNTFSDSTQRPYYQAIFRYLQGINHASLVPFGLDQGDSPSADVLTIMKWAANLFVLTEPTFSIQVQASNPGAVAASNIPALVKTAFINFVNTKLDNLATTSGPTTSTNISALANAFRTLTLTTLDAHNYNTPGPYFLSSVYLDNHDVFRTQLATVKNRLNNSFVDIRGCRVGQDTNFMQAIRGFFGNAGTEPTISGPEWYQQIGNIAASGNSAESVMDGYFNNGIPDTHITGPDVQREYSAWAGRIGINSQISFWTNLFNGNAFDLISLTWRSLLPPIGMESARLTALATQNYTDAIGTIKNIFHIAATASPIAADCTIFQTNSFPSIAALIAIQTAVTPLTDTSPQPTLQTQLTALTTMATALSATLPAAPSPLTIAHLTTCIDTLKLRLVTLSGIAPLITSIKTRLTDPKAGFRYQLDIGLPIILQSAAHEDDTRLLYYPDLQTNALKAFKKIQFEGPLPAATLTAINGINPTGTVALNNQGTTDPNDDTFTDLGKGLAYSRLASNHSNTQTAVNPSEEFHAHIITEPV